MAPSTTFPRAQALILCMAKISEAVAVCFRMPFVNQMVVNFGRSPASAPQYAGIIDSALIATEFICAPIWGTLADKVGRKPLVILGLVGFALAAMGMGLAQNLWQAILARCISGVLGAVAVLVRTVQFEITTSEHVDKVLMYMTPCWAIGASIGPLIGGAFSEPAKRLPALFSGTLFDRFPYLLPALVSACVPVCTAIGYLFLVPETLGNPIAESPSEQASAAEDAESECMPLLGGAINHDAAETLSTWSLLTDVKIAYALLCSALLAFVSMAYCAGFMMMASTAVKEGGLGLSPWQTGIMLAISSLLGFFVSSNVMPLLSDRYGYYRTLRLTSFAHVMLFPSVSVLSLMARYQGGVKIWSLPVLAIIMVCYEVGEVSYTPMDVVFSNRSPRGCLAHVNGFALSAASLGRVAAPALSGLLWSMTMQTRSLIGSQLMWIIFTFVAIIWHLTTRRLSSPVEFKLRAQYASIRDVEAGVAISRVSSFGSTGTTDTLVKTPPLKGKSFESVLDALKSVKSVFRSKSLWSDVETVTTTSTTTSTPDMSFDAYWASFADRLDSSPYVPMPDRREVEGDEYGDGIYIHRAIKPHVEIDRRKPDFSKTPQWIIPKKKKKESGQKVDGLGLGEIDVSASESERGGDVTNGAAGGAQGGSVVSEETVSENVGGSEGNDWDGAERIKRGKVEENGPVFKDSDVAGSPTPSVMFE
ncbi:major facilitator superfamily domain-containing protein [Kockovaella imperatae]|uniref:Major facilitator superfamily domain-containing protein n=1 Tax=Kockovaella imperatae TaxID=4999 RepID=A0A1Y1UU47_9TREE|nr:major facilitator superfamily domain-containing protein [Kockovaella imperatae]ORX41157.1 major facilitator superfamily domain-containing protein [Kockovaella imperatae]